MKAMLRSLIAAGLTVWAQGALVAATNSDTSAAPEGAATDNRASDSPAISAMIDREITAGWSTAGVVPAAPASDAEFLRRVYLDLVGTIPPAGVARQFIEDPSSNKRAELVDRLLDSPQFVQHLMEVIVARWAPETNKDDQARYLSRPLELWLRQQIESNAGYDKIVRELISISVNDLSMQNMYQRNNSAKSGPMVFFYLKESKPEMLAASTARSLLGVRIECAQCHDHPFGQWKRDEFWAYAAFFGGLEPPPADNQNQFMAKPREVQDRRELAIPGTDRVVQARFLDGNEPEWKARIGARVTLAEWITKSDNPFFARAMVNRTWAQFFGTGLVDPVDDMGPHNPPSHPVLLDALAGQFAGHGFDVKLLMRAIVLSRPYQLSSSLSDPTQEDRRQFARIFPRGLTPEQLIASVEQASGISHRNRAEQEGNFRQQNDVSQKFALSEDDAPKYETSIVQALEMMNGRMSNQPGMVRNGGMMAQMQTANIQTISAVVQSPFMTTRDRLETLYLATLSRLPTDAEVDRLTKYIANPPSRGAGPALTQAFQEALGMANLWQREGGPLNDIYWALLNSPEFMLNH